MNFYLILILSIVFIYIISILVGRMFAYFAAILHNWCMMVLYDDKYWYDKGTIIKDIYNDISSGENFKDIKEMKYAPVGNILLSFIWFLWEILFLILTILILVIKLIIYIFINYILKLFIPLCKLFPKFNWIKILNKVNILIINMINNIKNQILNFRIA